MCPLLYVVQLVFSLAAPSSLALQGAFSCPPGCLLLPSRVPSLVLQGDLHGGFCNGVVSSDVAKPGELASFYCCQQGLWLSCQGVYLLSHIFVCLVFGLRNTEESPEAFRCKCLYASLCLRCQSPALASVEEDGYSKCSVEFKLGVEADVSALPDGVKS